MNAKEKAEELVDKFYHAKKYANSTNAMSYELAKQCAIIAVDEIIKKHYDDWDSHSEYWQKVKTEIEAL